MVGASWITANAAPGYLAIAVIGTPFDLGAAQLPVQARAGAPWARVTCSLCVEIFVLMNMIMIKPVDRINTNNNIINNSINISANIIHSNSTIINLYYV